MNKKQINTSNLYYTIGHSIRPITEFIEILLSKNINLVVDVRSLPGSNRNLQYNKEVLVETLKNYKIK